MSKTDFPHLHSLMLGGLHSNRILTDLVDVWGHQLTTLKLETHATVIPLHAIGNSCGSLKELQIINARLSIDISHHCGKEQFFPNLKLVYFFLVNYVINEEESTKEYPASALHCILRHAKKLEGIQATGTSSFTDQCLFDIMKCNPLHNLRRFILTDAAVQPPPPSILDGIANQGQVQRRQHNNTDRNTLQNEEIYSTSPNLTARSVICLFETCPHLQCTGDLRHWNISAQERRHIFKLIQNRQNPTLGPSSCLSSIIQEKTCTPQ